MSWKVANLCAGRRFGSPVRKQIIMFLADKASDDGSGIWCSKGTIQRHTELGERRASGLGSGTGQNSHSDGIDPRDIVQIVRDAEEH